ncbi:hypothetical protein [Pseudomonas syringae pv. coryli]|uniref:hypothetical protein n=1 Tax=Pseudomonas syringae pv. coryli TaxID=317659 RepID=UPI003D2B4809
MFFEAIKTAYGAGQVRVGLRPRGHGNDVAIEAQGLTRIKVAFLSKAERHHLADYVVSLCRHCRTCGTPMPAGVIQSSTWHRQCANCYLDKGLATSFDNASEISVRVNGKGFRVFPHLSNDGLLAMRVLPAMASYVLLSDGTVRMRPDNYTTPVYYPDNVKNDIERSFIIDDHRADEARSIFAAYRAKDFEVID